MENHPLTEAFRIKGETAGTMPGPTCPVLFDGFAHFWEYCLMLTLFDYVLLTVPPEVIFDIALILGAISVSAVYYDRGFKGQGLNSFEGLPLALLQVENLQ